MRFLIFLLILPVLTYSIETQKAKTLYNSLDPHSISKHLALYELYPETTEGKLALQNAWELLTGEKTTVQTPIKGINELSSTIDALISLVNKRPDGDLPLIDEDNLIVIERIARRLPNRKLKGYGAISEEEVLALPWNEVDLARGLLLSDKQEMQKIRSYEAMIDLMALQILAFIPLDASFESKIRIINAFIFDELGFRFPPHSLYAKDVDLYTFLPSVLDSRRGVCLGVSILYLALSQRLNLPLETITPPGHIYVRYCHGENITNIETTARGIDTDSELYLGLETRSLQSRNIKDVIGLAHMNQAAMHWHHDDNLKALDAYRIALRFLPDDMLLKEFMGFNYLLAGEKEKGEELLQQVKDHIPDYAVVKDSIAEDYLNGKVDAEGIRPLFMHVDETRESILKKREAIIKTVEKYPEFRGGLFALASTWLQLHRQDEALKLLERLHQLDPAQPSVEYYLAVLYTERLDLNRAWDHLLQTEAIVQTRQHYPRSLKELRKHLEKVAPK